jgi:hypothetical protein
LLFDSAFTEGRGPAKRREGERFKASPETEATIER